MQFFAELGAFRREDPASLAVQKRIAALQNYITEQFYTCDDALFGQLSELYVSSPEMRQNIDHVGGKGTATFVKQAIDSYLAGRADASEKFKG